MVCGPRVRNADFFCEISRTFSKNQGHLPHDTLFTVSLTTGVIPAYYPRKPGFAVFPGIKNSEIPAGKKEPSQAHSGCIRRTRVG